MPRPKKVNVWEMSVKECCAKHDYNGVEELIKTVQEKIPLQEGDVENGLVAHLMDDYEIVRIDGAQYLRPKLKHRINVHSELAQYQAPKLRSTETKGQVDYNFNISIKRFDDAPEKAMVVDVSAKQLPE